MADVAGLGEHSEEEDGAPATARFPLHRRLRDSYRHFISQHSIIERDPGCFGFIVISELAVLYLALLAGCFVTPVGLTSCVYFWAFLFATPFLSHRRHFSLRGRKAACLAVAVLAGILLLLQVVMLSIWAVDKNQKYGLLLTLFSVDSTQRVSFSLFSLLLRDVAVLVASCIALVVLRAKEASRMTRPSPATEWSGPLTFLNKVVRRWRWLALSLLVLSSLIYPSLLSFPFYFAYLTTISLAAMIQTLPANPERISKHRKLAYLWELYLVRTGAVYTAAYLLSIYIFQIPALAKRVDLSLARDCGILHFPEHIVANELASTAPRAVLIIHTLTLFALYALSSTRAIGQLLSPPGPQIPVPRVLTDSSSPRQDLENSADFQSSQHPQHPHFVSPDLTTSQRPQFLLDPHASPFAPSAPSPPSQADSPSSLHFPHTPFRKYLRKISAKYGTHLCFVVYIILALQRPTALGFVFMIIVMIGAVLPNFIFRKCGPVLLVYTGLYAAFVYLFGLSIVRRSSSTPETLLWIGLPRVNVFSDGWLTIAIPLFMTTLLALGCYYRAEANAEISTPKRATKSAKLFQSIFGPYDWCSYLKHYLLHQDTSLYLCLNLCFIIGFSQMDGLHFPFIFLASFLLTFPSLCKHLWLLMVGYAQAFIVIQYWTQFKQLSNTSQHHAFARLMALPVIFFVFATRQLAVYVANWRQSPVLTPVLDSPRLQNMAMQRDSVRARARSIALSILFFGKILARIALLMLLWHLAFHTPLSVFAAGYIATLSALPCMVVFTPNYHSISHVIWARIYHGISFYACIVLSLLHLFCSDHLTGIQLENVGAGLTHNGRLLIILNWILQLLCVTQLAVSPAQHLKLEDYHLTSPQFNYAFKQILPFAFFTAIFAVSWSYISFAGALILALGILNAMLGQTVKRLWRITFILSVLICLSIVVFDLAAFESYTSSTLYWLGLRRGSFVPNPVIEGQSQRADNAALPNATKGWQLSPSAEAYLVIAYLAALQYFCRTTLRSPLHVKASIGPPSAAGDEGVPEDPEGNLIALDPDLAAKPIKTSKSCMSPTIIEAPSTSSFARSASVGEGQGGAAGPVERDCQGRRRSTSIPVAGINKKFRLTVSQNALGDIQHLLQTVLGTLLKTCKAFSFEICVIFTIIVAVLHADFVSFGFLGLFYFLVRQPRVLVHAHWDKVVIGLGLLIMCEYLVILRLPPRLLHDRDPGAFGGIECSIFRQFAASQPAKSYGYGQWLGLCLTNNSLVIMDFILLLLAIIQARRFKYFYTEPTQIMTPLFAPVLLEKPDPEHPPDPDFTVSLTSYLVIRYGGYFIVLTIFVLATLTFNLLSLGYLIMIAVMIGSHAQEGILTRRRSMWTFIAIYTWFCVCLRILFQIPSWHGSFSTSSLQVVLGLRKVHGSSKLSAHTPPELAFDAVILILIVIQRRVFLFPDFKRIVDELWYAEHYDYAAHGYHVVNQLEKIREEAMIEIRTQIKTMYDQLQMVTRSRVEEAMDTNNNWEDFLLKNRNTAALTARGLRTDSTVSESSVLSRHPSRLEPDPVQLDRNRDSQLLNTSDHSGPTEEPAALPDQTQPHSEKISHRHQAMEHQVSFPQQVQQDSKPLTAVQEERQQQIPQRMRFQESQIEQRRNSLSHSGPHMQSVFTAPPPAPARTPQSAPLRSSAYANSRPQSLAPPMIDTGSSEAVRRRRGSTGGDSTRMSRLESAQISDANRPGIADPSRKPLSPWMMRDRSVTVEASHGLRGLSNWVSGAIGQSTILSAKDPLLDLSGENERPTDRGMTSAVTSPRERTATEVSRAKLLSRFRQNTIFSPMHADMTEEPQLKKADEDEAADIGVEPKNENFLPPALPYAQQRRGSIERMTRLEQLVVNSKEEARNSNKIETRARQVILQLLQNLFLFLNSRSTSLVYGVLVFAHIYQPSVLSLIYPVCVFGYALLQNPRSLPRINGSLIHPMIQNPPRLFWKFLLVYAFSMIVLKFVFQHPYFCVCGNAYSFGRDCPSSLPGYEDMCQQAKFPHLDYFIHQPIVKDYYLGVFKAFHSLRWNSMSVRYEPVRRYVPHNYPGTTSITILDSGLGGAFFVTFLGDILVLLAVLWHTHLLKIRGVWLARDPTSMTVDTQSALNSQGNGPEATNDDTERSQLEKVIGKDSASDVQRPAVLWTEEVPQMGQTSPRLPHKRPTVLRSALHHLRLAFGETEARAKPGCDLYVSIFFIQVLLFIVVLLAYQQAEHLVQSVRENQLSGGFILVMLLHFIFIVADRIIYLLRSLRGKVCLQLLLLFIALLLIHSNFTFRIGISQHGPVFAWYIIICAYLFMSALQISYGYPPYIQTNWMTKRVHHAWGNVFRIYRALPFLYELRMMLDWACTQTTLYIGEWMKLEDIYSGLYMTECNLDFMRTELRRKGDKQPLRRKWLCGFLLFTLLNLLVWLPLLLFSTGSFSNYDNFVEAGSLSVQLNGFPTLYQSAGADYISPILPTTTWNNLAQNQPALAILPATSTNQYMYEMQLVRLPRASQELWQISPPTKAELLRILEGGQNHIASAASTTTLEMRKLLRRHRLAAYTEPEAERDNERTFQLPISDSEHMQALATKPASASTAGEAPSSSNPVLNTISTITSPISLTLQFSFKTQDASINQGAVTHLLSDPEKNQFAQVIRGHNNSVILSSVMPSVIRIAATKEVEPLVDNDIRADCILTFNNLNSSEPNASGAQNSANAASETEGITTGWWEFTCGNSAKGCDSPSDLLSESATAADATADGSQDLGCDPALYTISSAKTIGSYLNLGYSLIGLYLTVVFTIGRFVHMSTMNMKYHIIYDDLPRVEVLKELCDTIYLARMYKNLPLEEELYRELIDIYRRPQYIYSRSGAFRHWWVDSDEAGLTSYGRVVEQQLAKYK